MAVGIENIVSDTAKAFEGNPAALQQRYMQKQDLFDLLALNMIRKEQDAIKRGLLLKQQQTPGTILEQVEGEVRKNTADMAEGVKGALENKQAQTQANVNRLASAGVSGAPAPNMTKLADGGIVGFKEGKEVESKNSSSILDDAWYMIKSLATGLKKKDLEAIQEKEGDSYLMRYAKKVAQTGNALLPANILKTIGVDKSKEELNALIKKASESPPAFGSEFLTKPRFTKAKDKDKDTQTGIAQLQPKVDVGLQEALRKQNIKPDVKPPVVDEKKPVVPVDDLAQDKSAGIPAATSAFDAGKFAMDDAFNKQVKGGISDLINQDPQKAVDFAARTPAEQAFISKMLKERTDMRANMMDPDRLQTDRLLQTLLGARGATPGEAFRTSGLAGINAQRAQEKLRRSEFDALNKLFMDEANRTQTLKKAAFQDALGAKKQGVASGTSLTASEKTGALEADKLVAQISNNAVTATLKKDLNDINKQRNEILATGNIITGNTKMVQLYENAEAKGIKSLRDAATKEKASNFGSDKAAKDKLIDDKLAADIKKLQDSIKLKAKPFRDALKTATTGASNRAGGISETQKKADAIIGK
jgi:hypothetical protein